MDGPMERINLDQNATTPIDPEVLEAMRPFWLSGSNPESRHSGGRAARRAWTESVETIGRILGAEPDEVVLTSGGTEANNLAIFGQLRQFSPSSHVILSPIEHPAVSEPLKWLEKVGYLVEWGEVGRDGVVSASRMADLVRPETRLVTLMRAHNEVGSVQPVGELAGLLAERGIPVHTDAVQAVGRIAVDFHALGVSTLAASAHKLHGPAGVGVLLVRRGTELAPMTFGGGQQRGLRPGTPALALAVGFAHALQRWESEAEARTERWRRLRDRLEDRIRQKVGAEGVVRLGPTDEARRLPQTLLVGFPGVAGECS